MKEAHQEVAIAARTATLVVTTLSSFLTPMALSMINVALPSIGKKFGVDAVILGWIASSYILAAAMFLVPIGRIADIWGRKKIFLVGTAVFTASSFVLGISTGPAELILFRAFQGVGGAMIFGTGIAMLSSAYLPGERGKVLGINVAAVYLGLSLGPFLGGILTQYIGWRSIFFFNVPLGVFIIVLGAAKLGIESAEARGERFDYAGSFIYAFSLLVLVFGFTSVTEPKGGLFLVAGLAGLVVFVLWEARADSPLIDMALFLQNRVFTFSNAAALIHYSATFATSFLMSFYLQQIKGMTPSGAGMVLVSQPIVQVVFSPLAGRASDRIEPRIVASSGMAITAGGIFVLASLTGETPLLLILFALAVLGLGFALFSSPNTNAIMSSVERRNYGIASSMLATMRLLGQMFSMATALMVFSIYLGKAEVLPETHPLLLKSIKIAFTVFGVLCLAGVFASLSRGRLREGRSRT